MKRNIYKPFSQSLYDPFHIEKRKKIIEYFNQNNKLKENLITYAERFKKGQVLIYGKDIKINEYKIKLIGKNLKKEDVFNKDIRFHWEIYRAKHLYNVGLAYFVTKDETYSEAIINHLSDIEEFTPILNPLVSTNSMEASLKLINIAWVHIFLKGSAIYSKSIEEKLAEIICKHANYIYVNYEITYYGAENNHGLTAAIGLLYAFLLIPESKSKLKWEKFGNKILIRALKNQFLSDGVNFENSTNYHRFVFELLYFLYAAYYYNNKSIEALNQAITKIYKSSVYLSHSNGFIARMGDSDSGKFFYDLGTINEFNNIQYLETLCSGNNSYYETLIFDDIPRFNCHVNSDKIEKAGDYYSFREKDYSIIINSNNIGTRGKGNHQHNDFLSFELYTKYPFIVDPWNYCYTGDKISRNIYRSSLKHNCVVIDDREIVEFNPDRLFEFLGNIKVKTDKYENTSDSWTVTLSHDGYKDLSGGGQHSIRRYEFNKAKKQLKITDLLVGTGNHKLKISFNIPKEYWKIKHKPNEILFYNEFESYKINFINLNYIISDGEISNIFLSTAHSFQIEFYCDYTNKVQTELTIQPEHLYQSNLGEV